MISRLLTHSGIRLKAASRVSSRRRRFARGRHAGQLRLHATACRWHIWPGGQQFLTDQLACQGTLTLGMPRQQFIGLRVGARRRYVAEGHATGLSPLRAEITRDGFQH